MDFTEKAIVRDVDTNKYGFTLLNKESGKFVSYKEWKESTLPDTTSDYTRDRFYLILMKMNELPFNKSVDFNMWCKKNNASFTEKIDYLLVNKLIKPIPTKGIKIYFLE